MLLVVCVTSRHGPYNASSRSAHSGGRHKWRRTSRHRYYDNDVSLTTTHKLYYYGNQWCTMGHGGGGNGTKVNRLRDLMFGGCGRSSGRDQPAH